MLASSLVMVCFARPLASLFSDDPLVLERTTLYLRWMSLAQWSTGISVVLEGVMSGAGRPLAAGLAASSCAAIRLPMARQASLHGGLLGIWQAMILSRWLEGFLYLWIFRRSKVWADTQGGIGQVKNQEQ